MKNWKQLVIGLSIAVVALYYTLRNVSLNELLESFKNVDYIYLIPTAILGILSYVIRAYRWRVLISPMKDVPASGLYAPLMVGFMGNILPARAGEFLRAYLLSKKFGISFSGSFATIIVERVFDVIMLLILFTWVSIFHAEAFDIQTSFSGISLQTLATRFGQLCAILISGLIVFIAMLTFQKQRLLRLIQSITRFLPQKWHDKVEYLVEEFAIGLLVVKDFGAVMKITFYSLLVWIFIVSSYYPLYFAYDLHDKSIQSLLILTVMVCILIALLPTPAFLGSFQAGVVIGLHEIMGEPEITAVSYGMVCWGINFLIILCAGVFFILHEHLSVSQLVEVEERGEDAIK